MVAGIVVTHGRLGEELLNFGDAAPIQLGHIGFRSTTDLISDRLAELGSSDLALRLQQSALSLLTDRARLPEAVSRAMRERIERLEREAAEGPRSAKKGKGGSGSSEPGRTR